MQQECIDLLFQKNSNIWQKAFQIRTHTHTHTQRDLYYRCHDCTYSALTQISVAQIYYRRGGETWKRWSVKSFIGVKLRAEKGGIDRHQSLSRVTTKFFKLAMQYMGKSKTMAGSKGLVRSQWPLNYDQRLLCKLFTTLLEAQAICFFFVSSNCACSCTRDKTSPNPQIYTQTSFSLSLSPPLSDSAIRREKEAKPRFVSPGVFIF